jgi:hypothetical protein
MEGHEMMLVIRSTRHVVRDWDFIDSQIRKFKGTVEETRDMRGRDMIIAVG